MYVRVINNIPIFVTIKFTARAHNDEQGEGQRRRACDSHMRARCWHNFFEMY